jgi:esterase/lipase superfamily enzyme
LLVFGVVLSGCCPYRYTPYPPRASAALGELRDDHAAIQLHYATDRRPTGVESPALYYGAERTDELHTGTGTVSIPAKHGRGRLETPPLGQPRPGKHVALMTLSPPMDRESFVSSLRTQVERSQRREVFVFIHGYAAFFADAARRTAQIAHDVDFDGVAIAYSWPTQGWLLAYLIDGVNAEWTVPHLVEFLTLLADESGAEHIHLMAHSMGTRVLTHAIKEFVRDRPERQRVFDQVVLVAADMDAELFGRDYAPFVVRACQRLTIYVSAADWALGGSQRLHKYARLGQSGPSSSGAPWRVRVDLIDATAIDKGVVGHVYYGSSPSFLEDLSGVLRGELAQARGLQREDQVYKLEQRQPEANREQEQR